MKSTNVTITLATIIGNAILNTTTGTVESRYLDACLFNPKGVQIIIDNQRDILAHGNFIDCTAAAINTI